MENTLVLIQCKDNVGLVSSISQVLSEHDLNIITMREFVDEVACLFFARIECKGLVEDNQLLSRELEEALPENAMVRVNPSKQKKIAILVTKEYHCLGDILMRHSFKTLGGEIQCVIGNHEDLRAITERFSLPFYMVSHDNKDKQSFEKEVQEVLALYKPDYLVLAKFMRILSPDFIKHYSGRIINIHHSFLPAFIGANPYQQAFNRGVKIIGATAHFVTNDLDEGPIITQEITHVNHSFNASQMRIAGREVEKAVLSKAISLVLEDRVFITGNKTVVFE
ncbi:MAG TPA: formyltetrahydrofolate deformylase [Sphingobacteriaceae bacterium]|nr:formyltetrahydrofolate deformylase [Sphingobacteriaceae bacterium]